MAVALDTLNRAGEQTRIQWSPRLREAARSSGRCSRISGARFQPVSARCWAPAPAPSLRRVGGRVAGQRHGRMGVRVQPPGGPQRFRAVGGERGGRRTPADGGVPGHPAALHHRHALRIGSGADLPGDSGGDVHRAGNNLSSGVHLFLPGVVSDLSPRDRRGAQGWALGGLHGRPPASWIPAIPIVPSSANAGWRQDRLWASTAAAAVRPVR